MIKENKKIIEHTTFDQHQAILVKLINFRHAMQMAMKFSKNTGIKATKEFHEAYAKLIAVDGIIDEFSYLKKADLAKPMQEEDEVEEEE
jgi:hypothetical protein